MLEVGQMNRSIQEKLMRDLVDAQNQINAVEQNGNCKVLAGNYLGRTLGSQQVPLADSQGEHAYLSKVSEALETALEYGVIPLHMAPTGAPSYVAELVR